MRVGIIGTGAIAHKHAQAYRNIGFRVTACTNQTAEKGRAFAAQYGARFVNTWQEVCRDAEVDFVDVCTFPDFRLEPVTFCASLGKHIQVQKPIAIDTATARDMLRVSREGKILLGVASQHRFDDASLFLIEALAAGRLGKLLQCDCYVKWYRSAEYYSRPVKRGAGKWKAAVR